MFRCVAYTEAMRGEWDALASTKGTVFHGIAFRQILIRSFGYKCGYHAIIDGNDKICALIPLVIGRNLGLQNAGVSLPFVNFTDVCTENEAALQFAIAALPHLQDKCRLNYIELRLKDQSLDSPDWRLDLQHHTFVLPLSPNEEEVLSLSTASNRNHVRKVYKNNWFTASFDKKYLDDFYRVYVRRMKQLGSPAPDISFFQSFFENLPENSSLLTVIDKQTEKVVGGMLLLISPGDATLYYPYGANLLEYNSKYLNNFMYWEAVRFGIRSKMKYLDLGRSQSGSGTYKYKEQWGASAVQLKYLVYDSGRERAGPPNREKLHLFVELWKHIPHVITDYVGKQLIKYLMP